MDIRFLTTFLEVAQTRHFGKAADNLYLTQSAVSARIKLLEEYFNTSLFVRNRNSIQLSAAGEKLVPYAQTLAATLSDARRALNEDSFQHLVCAATPNAYQLYMREALIGIKQTFPTLSLRSDMANIEQLSRQLHDRSIDFAFTMEVLKSDDIESVQLITFPLALYNSKQNDSFEDYIHIDWSHKINDALQQKIPQTKQAKLKTSTYQIALSQIQRFGGCALLPQNNRPAELYKMSMTVDYSVSVFLSFMKGTELTGLAEIVSYFRGVNPIPNVLKEES